MAKYLDQLGNLQKEHKGCPIICCGDIFHRWNSNPELINFAIKHLPRMFAIPGNHDLPLHSYEDMHKSAYDTLVRAGVIESLIPGEETRVTENLSVWGFPWGFPVEMCPRPKAKDHTNLAVVHAYCWEGTHCHPGAEKDAEVEKWVDKLLGYDAACFGDNHKGFLHNVPIVSTSPRKSVCTRQVLNCGTFMRRTVDEIHYPPIVGLLQTDGSIQLRRLDTSEDRFVVSDEIAAEPDSRYDMSRLLKTLEDLGDVACNFMDQVRQVVKRKGTPSQVRDVILEILESIGEKHD